MVHAKIRSKFNAVRIVSCATTAALIAAGIVLLAPGKTNATPAYAAQTGKSCGTCHVNPAGGGALKAFGKKFQANGHKIK
jgi:hypothetical protein